MKGGTQEYDIMVSIGVVVLVFVIIYWTLTFGTQMVGNMLYFAPSVTQDSLSSFITIESTQKNANVSIYLRTGNMPFHIKLVETVNGDGYIINAIPPGKYFYGRRTERGGFVEFVAIDPISVITSKDVEVVTNDHFSVEENRNHIIIEKINEKISMGVK